METDHAVLGGLGVAQVVLGDAGGAVANIVGRSGIEAGFTTGGRHALAIPDRIDEGQAHGGRTEPAQVDGIAHYVGDIGLIHDRHGDQFHQAVGILDASGEPLGLSCWRGDRGGHNSNSPGKDCFPGLRV